MSTTLKNPSNKPKMALRESRKSIRQMVFGAFMIKKKWLLSAAVILFTFITLDCFCAPPFKDISEKPILFNKEETQVVFGQIFSNQEQSLIGSAGILGGPSILGSLVASVAQASIDFSADDAFEDADLLLLQENSLISANNPAGTVGFSEFNREVRTYVVKQGDTPEEIAISFGINSYTLLWANNLRDGDIIRPGDKLTILPINGVRVKVGAADTVASLAKKYKGDSMEIIAFNSLPLDGALKAGEYIIIPDGETPSLPKPKYTAPATKYAKSTTPASSWLIWPTSGQNWGRIHGNNGVDVANKCGTPIYAAATGKVIISDGVGWNGGYGKYVKIQHPNGVATLYAHATQLLVSAGEQVGQGQVIALMGTTGRSTGCHLHFEVRGAANPLAR
ncbi:MAG: peptidoglycan DD-metalloendopeptidase family protein [Candidatus Portnoybacteria bacterium]|nr:peptidoglycan DD-metalloendopeptidase family protein [Candidatus Portnoybacteria bacterium]